MFRKLLLLFLLFQYIGHLQAQEIELQAVKIHPDIQWRYEYEDTFDSTYFGLPSVQFSEYSTHIRIKLDGCIIDLHSSDGKEAKGRVFYHIDQYTTSRIWKHSIQEKTKKFYHSTSIDSATSEELIAHFSQRPTGTLQLQKEKPLIDSIYQRFGGIQLQLKDHNEYKQEFYYRPCNREMSDRIANLYMYSSSLIRKLDLEYGRDLLKRHLPRGRTYSYDTRRYCIYLSTKKELDKWSNLQPHRHYMDSVKALVDSFISQVIQNAPDSLEYQNYKELFLKFSKKGKLINIKTDYLSNKEFRTFKRHLFQLFKTNKIDFISPKRSYQKTLYFFNDRRVKISQ